MQAKYFNQLNHSEKLRLLEGTNENLLERLHQESLLYFNATVMEEVQRVLDESGEKVTSAWDGYLGFVNAVISFFDEIHPGTQ